MKTIEEWEEKYWKEGAYEVGSLISDVRDEAINYARQECASAVKLLNSELAESRDQTEGWIRISVSVRQDLDEVRGEVSRMKAELATLREQQPPVTGPQEPAESPIDKAARQAWERRIGGKITDEDWSRASETIREAWRRVVAPFVDVKPETPKPPTDGELLQIAWRNHRDDSGAWIVNDWEATAKEFLAKRAEQKNAKAPE